MKEVMSCWLDDSGPECRHCIKGNMSMCNDRWHMIASPILLQSWCVLRQPMPFCLGPRHSLHQDYVSTHSIHRTASNISTLE